MTKQEYLLKHPGIGLEMAPITGGADIQLSDYMHDLCDSLNTGDIDGHAVFSFSNALILAKSDCSESIFRVIHGALTLNYRCMLLRDLVFGCDMCDYEDGSVLFFTTRHGNIFIPDYEESFEHLHNHGYIRCVYENAPVGIGADLKVIQEYLEYGNDDSDCRTVCTTSQVGHDVKFELWYKEEE